MPARPDIASVEPLAPFTLSPSRLIFLRLPLSQAGDKNSCSASDNWNRILGKQSTLPFSNDMARCSLNSGATCGRQLSRSSVSTGSISGTRDAMNAPVVWFDRLVRLQVKTYSILSKHDVSVPDKLARAADFLTVQRLQYAAEEFIGVISIDPAHHEH